MVMALSLHRLFRKLDQKLESLRSGVDSQEATHARDLLQRDLLPRTAGEDPYLVVGIVGPSNAGKSALFNYLSGDTLSPSHPEGGLTRRLFGITSHQLFERLCAEPTLQRFPITPAEGNETTIGADIAETSSNPSDLLALSRPNFSDGLLLIDTPDFDSVILENRFASESLLTVADLVIVVVTRHSYQNREVVHFLQQWLDNGRPWILFYNEGDSLESDFQNATKLVQDLGSYPVAAYRASHSPNRPFEPSPSLMGNEWLTEQSEIPWPNESLRKSLESISNRNQLKSRALQASSSVLRDDLEALAADLASKSAFAGEVLELARVHTQNAGQVVANAALPLAPFVEACIEIADSKLPKYLVGIRALFAKVRLATMRTRIALPRFLGGNWRAPLQENPNQSVHTSLQRIWPELWDKLMLDLGRGSSHPIRESASVFIAEQLDFDLTKKRREIALEEAGSSLSLDAKVISEFRNRCLEVLESSLSNPAVQKLVVGLNLVGNREGFDNLSFLTTNRTEPISAPNPQRCDSLQTQLIRKILAQPIMEQIQDEWSKLQSNWALGVLINCVLPKSAPNLREVQRRESETAAELRAFSAEIGAGLAALSNSNSKPKIQPQQPPIETTT
jgi:hypothetical protein